jgi:hypothetical protein
MRLLRGDPSLPVEVDRLVGHVETHGCVTRSAAMSSAFGQDRREIKLAPPLITGRIGHHLTKAPLERRSFKARRPKGDNMTIGTPSNHSSATNPDREDALNEIARKWSKFSKRDLTNITTNDQLVGEIVKKYGIKKEAAQREVDVLMDGRNLSP